MNSLEFEMTFNTEYLDFRRRLKSHAYTKKRPQEEMPEPFRMGGERHLTRGRLLQRRRAGIPRERVGILPRARARAGLLQQRRTPLGPRNRALEERRTFPEVWPV